MRTAIGAAIINDGKILLVRKNKFWIFPGGQPENGESDLECLAREVGEELSGTKITNVTYYNNFSGRTPHTGDNINMRIYFADIHGELNVPSMEISEREWVSDVSQYNLAEATSSACDSLIQNGYL